LRLPWQHESAIMVGRTVLLQPFEYWSLGMRLTQILVTILITSIAAIGAFADDVATDPLETLETAIPEGIRLLEAKEYKVFVESFVIPSELKKIAAGTSLEEFAKTFGERKATRLLEVLQEIKDADPTLDETGTKATFALKEEEVGKESITFIKVEKRWYIQN
jgi:hypothetical protein